MSDLNNYSFTGRLGADAELKYTASGTAVWSGRIGVGYGYGDSKGTNWVTAKLFGKRAEALGGLNLTKGTTLALTGELQIREYTRNDGTKGIAHEVNATSVHLVGKRDGGEKSQSTSRQAPASTQTDEFPDEIPF